MCSMKQQPPTMSWSGSTRFNRNQPRARGPENGESARLPTAGPSLTSAESSVAAVIHECINRQVVISLTGESK
jgi:hypothetical protein